MDADKTLTWGFVEQYAVQVGVAGGEGSVTGLETPWQDAGTVITLEAQPGDFHVFSHWHTGVSSNPASFVVDQALDIEAVFVPETTDGVPHTWLAAYGLITTGTVDVAAVLQLDPDGDGHTNAQEFHAGTDPTNAASVFRLTFGDDALLLQSVSPQRLYRVYASTNLTGWTAITNLTVDAEGAVAVPLPGSGFYRATVSGVE